MIITNLIFRPALLYLENLHVMSVKEHLTGINKLFQSYNDFTGSTNQIQF